MLLRKVICISNILNEENKECFISSNDLPISSEELEPLVRDLTRIIQEKQDKIIKTINAETINLYWEIGKEIYRQQQEKGWGKSIVELLANELQKTFPGSKGYSAVNL